MKHAKWASVENDHLRVFIFTINTGLVCALMLVGNQLNSRTQRSTRIFLNQDIISFELSDIPVFIILGLVAVINFCEISTSQNWYQTTYLIVFGAIAALNLLSTFVVPIILWYTRKRKAKQGLSSDKLSFTILDNNSSKALGFSTYLYSILLIIVSVGAFMNTQIYLNDTQIFSVIEFSLLCLTFVVLLKICANLISTSKTNKELEEFEKEIFVSSLSDEEILKRLEDDFDGIPFSKWITTKNDEIGSHFIQVEAEFSSIYLDISLLEEFDQDTLPFEFSGRLKQAIERHSKLIHSTRDFTQRTSTVLRNIKNFGSLNSEERQSLLQVQRYLRDCVDSTNNNIKNVSWELKMLENLDNVKPS